MADTLGKKANFCDEHHTSSQMPPQSPANEPWCVLPPQEDAGTAANGAWDGRSGTDLKLAARRLRSKPLLTTLAEKVIAPAEGKVKALAERRRLIEAELPSLDDASPLPAALVELLTIVIRRRKL
jgi:hypothetical protein